MAIVLVAVLAACGGSGSDGTLTPQEQRLVDESLQLMRVRIEEHRDADRAELLRSELPPLMGEEERDALLDALAADPLRGQKVLEAIHDSLQAMRERFFPPAQGGTGLRTMDDAASEAADSN